MPHRIVSNPPSLRKTISVTLKNILTATFIFFTCVTGPAFLTTAVTCGQETEKLSPPNIVWVMGEDMSTELSCYGHPAVTTPNFDSLARDGFLFSNAFGTAPSCTPARNAMMTGVYQTRTDTQDQRRPGITLPTDVRPITKLLQEAGYYTALGCGYSNKLDLNFNTKGLFDGKDWSTRKPGQPFFAQITLYDSHRLKDGWAKITRSATKPVDRQKIKLPSYFPNHPTVREDWARYLESIQSIDDKFGQLMQRLADEKLIDNTLVIFMGDNGRCHLRGKCWLYDAGLQVPLLIRLPKSLDQKLAGISTGNVDDLVSTLDVSATILDAAGIPLPSPFDGQSLLSPNYQPRDVIFGARDQVDEVVDHIRCARSKNFKYIRNYNPENGYRECRYVQRNRPMLAAIRELDRLGELTSAQQLLLKKVKPREELYNVENDPDEVNNLAADPQHKKQLVKLRKKLDDWIKSTGDTGLQQHAASLATTTRPGMAQSDAYLNEIKKELTKKWPKNRTIKIVTHGHSVPTGYFRSGRVETFGSYPHLLHQKLAQQYPYAVINVTPTGIGGETAVRGVKRFERDVLALNPDVITIDYGLNDRGPGLKKSRTAWTQMIKMAKAKGIKVILLTPTGDLNAKITDATDPLSQHAAQIRELAAEHQVGLVDSYGCFVDYLQRTGDYKEIMSQGNHPNRRGHTLVAEQLTRWFLP
jgi:arylsulfatase A-like enzyme/lysophospholipase L1-like esterase